MADVHTPTLRGRRLALELRRLREEADLTPADAAKDMNWPASKLSRIESAKRSISNQDLHALLQMLGVEPGRQPAILQLNRDAWQRGWWTVYGNVFTGVFPMLESQAQEIHTLQMGIPGLFQTPEYAAELFRRMLPAADEADITRRVEARMARQAILRREHPPLIHAVIDESAVRRIVGGPKVMAAQVQELLRLAQLPAVTIQIVPFDAGVYDGMDGGFTLFGHPEERGLDVAYTEGQHGETSLEGARDLARLRLRFRSVSETALSPEATSEWLAALWHGSPVAKEFPRGVCSECACVAQVVPQRFR